MKYTTVINDETATIRNVESASYAIYEAATELKKRVDHTLKGGNYKLEIYEGGKESLAGKPIEKRTIKSHPKVPSCTSRRGHKWEDEQCTKCGLIRNITENTVVYKKYETGYSTTTRRARVSDAIRCIDILEDDYMHYEVSLINAVKLIRESRVVITVDDYNGEIFGICSLVKNWGKSARIEHLINRVGYDYLTDCLLDAVVGNSDLTIYMQTIFVDDIEQLENYGFVLHKYIDNYYRNGETVYEYKLNKKK